MPFSSLSVMQWAWFEVCCVWHHSHLSERLADNCRYLWHASHRATRKNVSQCSSLIRFPRPGISASCLLKSLADFQAMDHPWSLLATYKVCVLLKYSSTSVS